ncbi:hypothetical protein KM043_011301 [Ampulex compressa]|nr:hypothetical protein KM043_011301 [Ampulex compressa]
MTGLVERVERRGEGGKEKNSVSSRWPQGGRGFFLKNDGIQYRDEFEGELPQLAGHIRSCLRPLFSLLSSACVAGGKERTRRKETYTNRGIDIHVVRAVTSLGEAQKSECGSCVGVFPRLAHPLPPAWRRALPGKIFGLLAGVSNQMKALGGRLLRNTALDRLREPCWRGEERRKQTERKIKGRRVKGLRPLQDKEEGGWLDSDVAR